MSSFSQDVYAATKQIPKGKLSTYKLIAEAVGRPGASRAVGTVLSHNPYAPMVPCHRVISSTGSLGGYFGDNDTNTSSEKIQKKLNMLLDEGLQFDGYVLRRSITYRKSVMFAPKLAEPAAEEPTEDPKIDCSCQSHNQQQQQQQQE